MAQDGNAARTIEGLPPPVEGPAVWYGPDMAKRTEWVHALSAEDLGEIELAMRPLADAQADIARITKADFPLPKLAPKLARICNEVVNGRGFALMRGLPVDRWSIREAATAYFGIGSHFGNARSQNAKGHVLGHVATSASTPPRTRPRASTRHASARPITPTPATSSACCASRRPGRAGRRRSSAP